MTLLEDHLLVPQEDSKGLNKEDKQANSILVDIEISKYFPELFY